jgi:DNA-binding ferritin-like protein (Dps family)
MLQETRDDINEKRKVLQARMDAQAGFDRAGWGHKDENGNWVKADWANKTGNDTGSARNLLNANGATQDMLNILGYDDKTLSDIITRAEQGNEDAKAQLTEMYQRMASFQQEDLSTQQSELDEMMASTATSIEELNKMQKEGLVGSKWGKSGEVTAYEKQLKYLTTTALNTAESLEELNTAWSKNSSVKDAQVDIKVYRENLQRLAEQYSTASEELEAYQKAIESNDTKAIKAAENTLKNAIQLGEAANQYGVNADELEKLTREMMDSSNMGFNAAMKTAIGYMTLAEELGISVEELQNTLAVLASSFDDLKTAEIDALFTQISDKAKELGVSVTELAEQVASLGTQFGVSGEDALEMAALFNQANSDLGVSNDELIIQTQNIASEFGLSAKAAAKLAVENQRMNKGVATLTENWQDWKNTLKTADKTSTDYAKAMGELTQVVRDLTGAGDDFVMTSEFLEKNMELIEQAANGDTKAINLLGVATAKATVSAMEFSQEFADAMNKAAQEAGIDSPFEHLSRDFETNKSIVE